VFKRGLYRHVAVAMSSSGSSTRQLSTRVIA
jgi:hypothetical protein